MPVTIPALDLMWLLIESPSSTTHVGVLMVFNKPSDRSEDVVTEIVEAYRSAKPCPPFNYVPDMLTTGAPCFREVDDWDPEYHVRHISLPDGASYDDLLRLVADLHEPMLDRDRPLFRFWAIDGIPEDRFALYAKVHHSIVDGVSGLKLIASALSTTDAKTMPPPAFAQPRKARKSRPAPPLIGRVIDSVRGAAGQVGAVGRLSVGAGRKVLSGVLRQEVGGSVPFAAHSAPTNRLKRGRAIATMALNIQEMRDVGHHFGGTLNDVAVTIVDAGLHDYLRRTGEPFEHRLVAMCPISLRGDSDSGVGTKVSAMAPRLGEPDAAVVDRMHQVMDSIKVAKKEIGALSNDAAMMYATGIVGLAGLTSVTRLDKVAGLASNLVISNVPGIPEARYLNGGRLLGLYPINALAVSIGLTVTLCSYDDQMDFGITSSVDAVKDPAMLARCILEAYQELKAAAYS